MNDICTRIKIIILYVVIFLVPLFFLPITQEFYTTNKSYLLILSIVWILIIDIISVAVNKKIRFRYSSLSGTLGMFIIIYAFSLIISSPNKIGALTGLPVGFGAVFALGFLYLLGIQSKLPRLFLLLNISALIVGAATIIFFLLPFQNTTLPVDWQFLKNPQFTPFMAPLDRTVFLGFFWLYQLSYVIWVDIKKIAHVARWLIFFFITTVSLIISIYLIVSDKNGQKSLPPYSVSWYAAVETLKKPHTALIGVGIDNFASMFTRAKTVEYNKTDLWDINFNQSRSFIFQLMTETGVLGVLTFFLLFVYLFKCLLVRERVLMMYLLAVFFLFPPSFILLFLFFILMIIGEDSSKNSKLAQVDVRQNIPLLYGLIICVSVGVVALGYFAGRAYLAEYSFKRSIDGILRNNVPVAYTHMRSAIRFSPFTERFRSSFSQLHLAVANNIIRSKKSDEINPQDRQDLAQAIKVSISEAQALTALNPEKSDNWAGLAGLYATLVGDVQDADQWAITSYERAIMIDPANPSLLFNLGSIYYRTNRFNQAVDFFIQAVRLKPDWANAQYNLAWAFFQKKDYAQAVSVMENVLTLVQAKSPDFKRASTELDEFKQQLPKKEIQQNPLEEENPIHSELSLPSIATPTPTGDTP